MRAQAERNPPCDTHRSQPYLAWFETGDVTDCSPSVWDRSLASRNRPGLCMSRRCSRWRLVNAVPDGVVNNVIRGWCWIFGETARSIPFYLIQDRGRKRAHNGRTACLLLRGSRESETWQARTSRRSHRRVLREVIRHVAVRSLCGIVSAVEARRTSEIHRPRPREMTSNRVSGPRLTPPSNL